MASTTKVIYVRCDPKKNGGAVQRAIGVITSHYSSQEDYEKVWYGMRYPKSDKATVTAKKFKSAAAAEAFVRGKGKAAKKRKPRRKFLGII